MATAPTESAQLQKPLRVWPGLVIVALQWLIRFVVPGLAPEAAMQALMIGVFGGALAVIVWWLFFSRAPWVDRLGAIALMVISIFATSKILHESIATGGMGMLFIILLIPFLCLTFVGWAFFCRNLATGPRRVAMVATILLTTGAFGLLRTGGTTGDFQNDLAWRWSETPEERLLAQTEQEAMVGAASGTETPPEWPGFLGPNRDAVVRGTSLETDWSASPPVELWRRAIGPGWSSFAVHGDLLYTQEQRGENELIACYRVSTGEPVWRHLDATRFWESMGGAGPRGTPTLHDGRLYALGGTGILNALDAANGTVIWSRNAATDTGAETPVWGFSSSPLVIDDLVIVTVSGVLTAYDLATGDQRWTGPTGGESYSSPHLATLEGVSQVLTLNGAGLSSVMANDGTLLWQHEWSGYPIVQPRFAANGDILISVEAQSGIRRLAISHGTSGWTVEEGWTSKGLKPYYSEFVVHEGHAYGFDGSLLAAVNLEDGKRVWKGGRYGAGQLFLLADQGLLMVLAEDGELALVAADPDKFTEIARFPAIEGKTWNHPVLVGDVLLVRNAEEMAAFRLSLAGA